MWHSGKKKHDVAYLATNWYQSSWFDRENTGNIE
jgi:hypothetical protein